MKKFLVYLLASVLSLTLLIPALAEESEGAALKPSYIGYTGEVAEVRPFYDNDGNVVGGVYYLHLKNEESEDGMVFYIGTDTYVPAGSVFAVGDTVTAFYDGNAPAVMIYPPQMTALAVARQEENLPILKVDQFDEELISSDGMLKLINPDTVRVVDLSGAPYENELAGQVLAVYYGPSTRSIPAQTTPDLVVVLAWPSSAVGD